MSGEFDVQRDLGKHEAQIDALKQDIVNLAVVVKDLTKQVHRLQSTLDEARGSWRIITAVAGISGTLGFIGAKLASFLPFVK